MSSAKLETLLARLLVDESFRAEFLEDPRRLADHQELDAAERAALLVIDRVGLAMAARSIAMKHGARRTGPVKRALQWIRRPRA